MQMRHNDPRLGKKEKSPNHKSNRHLFFKPASSSLIETPVADAVLSLKKRSIHSFHALPLSYGNSLNDLSIKKKYIGIYGDDYFSSDITFTGEIFDSFFFPKT